MVAPRAGARAGYTLVELMMVVVILGIGASATIPGLMNAMADRRAAIATRRALLLAKLAQSKATSTRRAHVLSYTTANNGTLELIRGNNASCSRQDWVALRASACGQGDYLRWTIQGNDPDLMPFGWSLNIRNPDNAAFALCYTPSGIVWHSDGLVNFQAATTQIGNNTSQGGGYRLVFERMLAGSVDGISRTVILPLGGSPRIVR